MKGSQYDVEQYFCFLKDIGKNCHVCCVSEFMSFKISFTLRETIRKDLIYPSSPKKRNQFINYEFDG